MTPWSRWRDLGRRAVLVELSVLVVGALAALGLTGYLRMDLSRPAQLTGDHLFTITLAKTYIEGHGFRLNDQLGFPDVQDWLRFPSFDLIYRLWLWLEVRVVRNPFTAVHGMYIAGILAWFGFAYWALRRFGVRRWLSALGAMAMIFTPFLQTRAFAHDFLVLQFAVPLGMATALMIGLLDNNARLKDFLRDPFIITTIMVVGSAGLYYAFYSLMFIVFVGVASSLGQRRWLPLTAAACVALPLFLILLFSGYGLDLPLALGGKFAGPHRFAFEQLVYGLDLKEAATPFGFIPKVAKGFAEAQAALPAQFTINEWPAAPLALIILASPLVAVLGLQFALEAHPNGAVSGAKLIVLTALCLVFGLLFGLGGGLGFLFNLLVTPEIRADGRLMPFLVFAAVIIATVGVEQVSAAGPALMRYGAPALVAILLVLGILPEVGTLDKIQQGVLSAKVNQQLLASVHAMLGAKDTAKITRVLELPVVTWPEAAPVVDFEGYQHQLPFILDRRHSPTRWSYGANDRQPWFSQVQLTATEPSAMVVHARAIGYDAILIEKRGYKTADLAAMNASLATQLAPGCRLYDDALMTLYALPLAKTGRC